MGCVFLLKLNYFKKLLKTGVPIRHWIIEFMKQVLPILFIPFIMESFFFLVEFMTAYDFTKDRSDLAIKV